MIGEVTMNKTRVKEDLRVKKTKEKLCTSLLELMQTQSLETISISDLCNKSGISRATFYNNFNTIHEVFNCYLVRMKNLLADAYHEKSTKYHFSLRESLDFLINLAIDFIYEKKDGLKNIIDNNVNSNFTNIAATFFTDCIKEIIILHEDRMSSLEISFPCLASFGAGGLSFLFVNALYSEKMMSKDELEYNCHRLVFNLLRLSEVKFSA